MLLQIGLHELAFTLRIHGRFFQCEKLCRFVTAQLFGESLPQAFDTFDHQYVLVCVKQVEHSGYFGCCGHNIGHKIEPRFGWHSHAFELVSQVAFQATQGFGLRSRCIKAEFHLVPVIALVFRNKDRVVATDLVEALITSNVRVGIPLFWQ